MSISYEPMRKYMKEHKISYYFLAEQGIESPTLHRIRHDKPITTKTLGKICRILKCQPGELIEYIEDKEDENKK